MNVITICCDTFRYDCLTDPTVHTPNLDRLVDRGAVFHNAWAEGLPTIQARRTLFTGRRSFPWRFPEESRGLWPVIPGWHRIPTEQTTAAELLVENGYCTGLVADTYHMFKATQNFTRGFCSYNFIRGQEGDPVRSGPLSRVDISPYHPEGKNDLAGGHSLTQYLLNMLDRQSETDYLPARVFTAAADWLRQNRENTPFYLWVDSFAPHEFWDPPREFADRYYRAADSRDYIQPQRLNDTNPSDDEIKRTRALYHGYVTFVDKWIGHLFAALDALDLWTDTVIIFTSDHGTELWDKGRFGKGGDRLYPYNAQVPLVIAHPEIARGTSCDMFVQHQDITATTLGILGIDTPDGMDGENIWPLVTSGKDRDTDKIIIAWDRWVSIRSRDWMLCLNSEEINAERFLYDLQNDPNEERNVAAEHPDIVQAYTDFLTETLRTKLPVPVRHTGDRRQAPPWARLYAAYQADN